MVGPVWKGVMSAVTATSDQWNNAPTLVPMHASALGIIAERTQEMVPVNAHALEGAVWLGGCAGDTAQADAADTAASDSADGETLTHAMAHAQLAGACHPSLNNSTPIPETPTDRGAAKMPSLWRQLPSVASRRIRRSHLLRSATRRERSLSRPSSPEVGMQRDVVPSIPLYGDKPILKLEPRRAVEYVEGTLYDKSGPFMEGATTDSLSVRLFCAPESGVSYLITTPDNRVFSAAKRRRWAMDNEGHFFAAMELKSVEAKLTSVSSANDPVFAEEYEEDLRNHFLDDALDELQKAETLTHPRPLLAPHILQTEDEKIVRLEEDYPEEAFFAIAGCTDEELYPVIALVFVEAITTLWWLHSHGWMHGDIKLENLMFTRDKDLVLIDFENASPFRGSRSHDGKIQLLSFDWTPPELEVSLLGRRMGPSGDLWALGCNLIRAFALRDGVEDSIVRESLLGAGRAAFFAFRKSLLPPSGPNDEPGYGVDLLPIVDAPEAKLDTVPRYQVHPARLLRRFARTAPCLLQYLLAYSVAPTPAERCEYKGMQLAKSMRDDSANADLWRLAKRALSVSIDMSGSAWVRPKLDEARTIMELEHTST
ncbi:hypothetical protein MVES_003664 [Malassezia vespertilionis]|uniref:Protein kinase domain-containing protein n=2 Tax=Malassezia vespertilionis TaxID=2020962 RepID=A0A2N1J7F3_9BASI|nr:hypothetical protein MVES_003664 [Malassezia vespertilionis]